MSDQGVREALQALAEPPRVQPGVSRSLVAAVERRRRRRRGVIAGVAAAVIAAAGITAMTVVGRGSDDPEPAGPTGVTRSITGDVVRGEGEWTRFEQDAPLEPRDHPTLLGAPGRLYVLGGTSPAMCGDGLCDPDETQSYRDGAVLDLQSGDWSPIPALPDGLAPADAAIAGDRLVVGGYGGTGDTPTTYVYSVEDGSWTTADPVPADAGMSGPSWDGTYLHGLDEQTVWSFDVDAVTWSDDVVPPLPWTPRKGATGVGDLVAGADGELYLDRFGGEFDSLARWRPGDDSWEELRDLPWGPAGGISSGLGAVETFWSDGVIVRGVGGDGGYAVDPDGDMTTDLAIKAPKGACVFSAFGAAGSLAAVQEGVLFDPSTGQAVPGPACPQDVEQFSWAGWGGSRVIAIETTPFGTFDWSLGVYVWQP